MRKRQRWLSIIDIIGSSSSFSHHHLVLPFVASNAVRQNSSDIIGYSQSPRRRIPDAFEFHTSPSSRCQYYLRFSGVHGFAGLSRETKPRIREGILCFVISTVSKCQRPMLLRR